MFSLGEWKKYDRINQSKAGLNKNCLTSIKNRGALELNFLRKTCLLKKLSIRKREISTSAKVKWITENLKWNLPTSYSKTKWKRGKLRQDKNVGVIKSWA